MLGKKTIVGVFSDENAAIRAIDRLLELGYEREDISVLAEHPERYLDGSDLDVSSPQDIGKGAAAGAITGGMVGGFGALIASLSALAIPGIGPILAAGPIAATLSGMVAGTAVGGAVGALAGLGINKEEARLYEQNLKKGDILVFVEADEAKTEAVTAVLSPARDFIEKTGGSNVADQRREGPRFAAGSPEDSILRDPTVYDFEIPDPEELDDPDNLDRLDDDVPPYPGDPLNDRPPNKYNELDSEV